MNYKEFLNKFQKKEVIVHQDIAEHQPMVSVCVQTYQHGNYIKECLDGILMQQTTFPFEILLGEDASTDGTREICMEYAQKHPDKIRLFLHHRENNIAINGNPTGRFNFLYNLYNARGNYIALCEGDDYWTDPLKLQKQVNFLEANPDYSLCFHNVKIFNQETNSLQKDTITREVNETTSEEDLAMGNYIHTPSVVLRNDFKIPSWFDKVSLGDWSLYMLSLKERKIFKFEEEMAVYRIHSQNLWAKNPIVDRVNKTIESIRIVKKNVSLSKTSKSHLNKQIQSFFNQFGVSICLPTYIGAKYLSETLQSIQSQTYQNIELIVSDDASADNTLAIVEAFKNNVDFPVHIFKHKPNGIGANWNNCLKHAKGKYIKFLFQDDVMEKECLEKMVQVLEENPEVGLVASKRNFIIENNIKNEATVEWLENYGDLQKEFTPSEGIYMLTKDIFKSETFYSEPINKIGEPSTVMFRKKIINEIGLFNESLVQVLDYEYWYRILKKYPIFIINKPLVKFRLHLYQATNLNRNNKINDSEIYEKILFTDFLSVLHPQIKKRLKTKYDKKYRFYSRLKNKFKNLFS